MTGDRDVVANLRHPQSSSQRSDEKIAISWTKFQRLMTVDKSKDNDLQANDLAGSSKDILTMPKQKHVCSSLTIYSFLNLSIPLQVPQK